MTIGLFFVILFPWVTLGFLIYSDYKNKAIDPLFTNYVKKSLKDSPFNFMLILLVVFCFVNFNLQTIKKYESWDNCFEYYDECEVECIESGIEVYECAEFVIIESECYYPCKKRKYD